MPLNKLWTRFSYFCLFFLFKYDEVIIKHPSSSTFCIKVVKFLEIFGRFLKIKNHRYLAPLTNLGKYRSFRGWLDNVEYGNYIWVVFFIFILNKVYETLQELEENILICRAVVYRGKLKSSFRNVNSSRI